MLIRGGRWVVVVLLALLAAGCGGGGGSTPTEAFAKAPHCSVFPATGHGSSYAGGCRSPGGAWQLAIRERSGSKSILSLTRRGQSRGISMYAWSGCCLSYVGWAKPHLLLFDDDYEVMSLDPASRQVRILAHLAGSSMAVSPGGRWFAGNGPGGPEDPGADTVYVLSADARTCVVVPGRPASVQGFTRDNKAIIVLRSYRYPKTKLLQYTISSLRPGCPAGYNGVLAQAR